MAWHVDYLKGIVNNSLYVYRWKMTVIEMEGWVFGSPTVENQFMFNLHKFTELAMVVEYPCAYGDRRSRTDIEKRVRTFIHTQHNGTRNASREKLHSEG